MSKVTFYDIPTKGTPKSWSPYTSRTRILLNYRGIPYETKWTSYPDIAPTLQALGIKSNGSLYTCPAISHGDTHIMGSMEIAKYLEKEFPDRPSVFPPGSEAFFEKVQEKLYEKAYDLAAKLSIYRVASILDERGAEYFRRTRDERFKMPVEEWHASATEQNELWKEFKTELDRFGDLIAENGGPFLMGDKLTYSDIILVACLNWVYQANPEPFPEAISNPNIQRLWQETKKYLV